MAHLSRDQNNTAWQNNICRFKEQILISVKSKFIALQLLKFKKNTRFSLCIIKLEVDSLSGI